MSDQPSTNGHTGNNEVVVNNQISIGELISKVETTVTSVVETSVKSQIAQIEYAIIKEHEDNQKTRWTMIAVAIIACIGTIAAAYIGARLPKKEEVETTAPVTTTFAGTTTQDYQSFGSGLRLYAIENDTPSHTLNP